MAKLYNLARMTTATTGTGTITLGAAVSGYLTFALAGVANADVVDYAIKDGANSESGTGTYASAGTTLTRTVTKSTNGNAAISLSGTAEVFISPRAETLNDASVITTGTMAQARLGSGSGGTGAKVLADDQTYKALPNVTTQASPGTPTGTASASATMMGLGGTCKITPAVSTRVFVLFTGTASCSAGVVSEIISLRYGTGVAPSNGAAGSGTQLGPEQSVVNPVALGRTGFTMGGIITGLTPGTAYWMDLTLRTGSGSTVTVDSIGFSAYEF